MRMRSLTIPALLLLALLLGRDLLLPPIHGIADNKDFWRVMVPSGILYESRPSGIQFKYVQRTFGQTAPKLSWASTSAALPALFTRLITGIFSPTFDIRVLGAFYLLVFLSGLYFLLRSLPSLILAAGIAWISLEPTLYLHFNSFFSVSLHLAVWPWLLWGLGETARRLQERKALLLPALALAGSALLIGTSKMQFAPVPLIALAVLPLAGAPARCLRKPLLALGLATLAVLAFSFLFHPPGKKEVLRLSQYQSVFGGIAAVAEQPSEALSALGIPEEYHQMAGKNLPEELIRGELPSGLMEKLERISRLQLLGLYFSERGALPAAFGKITAALALTPLGYLGHYEPGAGAAGEELRHFWQFSHLRDTVLSWLPWLVWILPLLAGIVLFQAIRQGRPGPEELLLVFLLLHFFSQLAIVVLGDGIYALQRHFIVARLCWDLMLWILLACRLVPWLTKLKISRPPHGSSP